MTVEQDYPTLWKVIDQIAKQSPFQKKAVLAYVERADKRWCEFGEELVTRMLEVVDRDDSYEYLARTYLWYTKTIRIEELFFSKEGSYRYSEYDEVYEKVYSKSDYMFDYVVGLGLTQIFWPNHWEIMKFFQDTFLPRVKQFQSGAEIGVGHGLFHSELLRHCPQMRSKLVDVSPVSLNMTHKMLSATGIDATRTEAIQQDIQKGAPFADNCLEALLMGELIEHIQEGEAVMAHMAKKMSATGYCYFSTAANSPAEDHILLFRTVDEIRQLVQRTGWQIVDEHIGTLNNLSVEESEKTGRNINYAAVLSTSSLP